MAMVLMGLGSHRFYVPSPGVDTPSFETIDRDSTYNWVAQNRLSREPAQQYIGEGEDLISIDGRLFPQHFGGFSTIHALRQSAQAGKPLSLIKFHPASSREFVAAGELVGQFVIKRIRVTSSKIGANGVQHKLDFSIQLSRFGEDGAAGGTSVTTESNDIIYDDELFNNGGQQPGT